MKKLIALIVMLMCVNSSLAMREQKTFRRNDTTSRHDSIITAFNTPADTQKKDTCLAINTKARWFHLGASLIKLSAIVSGAYLVYHDIVHGACLKSTIALFGALGLFGCGNKMGEWSAHNFSEVDQQLYEKKYPKKVRLVRDGNE